jgi:serine protease
VLWHRGLGRRLLCGCGLDQWRLAFDAGLTTDEAQRLADRLRQRPEVAWVEPDTREPLAQSAPSDPLYSQQWWLQPAGGTNANALAERRRGVPGFQTAWATGLAGATGRPSAIVAVLDTGTTAHPDLAGRFLPGYDFVSESVYGNDGDGRDADPSDPGDWVTTAELSTAAFAGCEATDSSWHGTLIAGLVAAVSDNGTGGAGANRDGRILPVRVAGKCGAALSDIVDGMRWAAGLPVAGAPPNPNPARIVNISFGGTSTCGPTYQAAVDELRAMGVVVVAAAGNAHAAEVTRPASCTGAIGVVALNRDGFKTTYSNFGAALTATGIATVGGDDPEGRWGALLSDGGLLSAHNSGLRGPGSADYTGLYGTSFSAPLAAATLSLMLSVNPALTAAELVAGLRLSARPHVTSPRIGVCSDANPGRCICTTATCGAGILDAEQALRYAAAPQAYVPPPRATEVIDNPEVVQAAALGPDRGTATVPGDGGGSGGGGSAAPSGGGGGAFGSWPWLAGLLAAVVLLRRVRR